MPLRKVIFWLHLSIGLAAGLIIFLMCVTGTLLTYERQITARADGYKLAPQPEKIRLPLEDLIAKARENRSNTAPASVILRADRSLPATIMFGRDTILFVDPYSGDLLGEGAKGLRQFFRTVTTLHRWLALPETSRETGRAVTGAANLAFLVLVSSGVCLWWPRSLNWNAIKAVVLPNPRLKGKARDWNWHNVTGFWSAGILFFIVVTGVIMSYPWANNLLYKLTGSELPPPRTAARAEGGPLRDENRKEGGRRDHPGTEGSAKKMNWAAFDKAIEAAQEKIPDWHSISLRFTGSGKSPVVMMVDQGDGGRPDLRTQLTADASSGDIIKSEDFASYNRGRQLRSWSRFVHTGEAGGFAGQSLAGLASLGGAILAWTGISLSWRRFFKKSGISESAAVVPKADGSYLKTL